MKILIQSPRQREEGVAVIVVLALLSIMLIFVNANTRALYSLGRELKLVEQQQIKRLNARTSRTNAVTAEFSTTGVSATSAVSRAASQARAQ